MDMPSEKREIFGKQAKKWWDENKSGWKTQDNLAKHLGIGRSTLGSYIRGERFPPPEIAEKLYQTMHLDFPITISDPTPQIPLPENAIVNQVEIKSSNIQSGPPIMTQILSEKESQKDKDKINNILPIAQISTEADRQELYIPVFGFVWLYPEELRILDHPAVQRLGHINQLGLSNLVYRGATHKRLEHSIGAVHVVQRMINAVRHTAEKARQRNERCGTPIQNSEERFIRLGALLHDVGHIVAGHTIEDEMCLVCYHDSDERLDKFFIDNEKVWVDRESLSLEELINREFFKYLPKGLAEAGITSTDIVRLLIRKLPKNTEDRFANKQKILAESSEIRLEICRDIIGNTICADLLDYLHRDWYHIGKMRTFDDRILQYMEICPKETSIDKQHPVPKNTDQFVVCLGKSPKIRTDAVSQILELLEWRYQLAESVLFHRAKLGAEAMLDRALYDLWGSDNKSAENILLGIGDDQLFSALRKIAEEKKKDSIASRLLNALEKRQLFTSLFTLSYYDLLPEEQRKIQSYYSPGQEPSTLPAAHRNQTLEVLEHDFGLTSGSLAMFCPGGSMKAKVADVVITVGDEALRFSKYEEQTNDSLSAGHLTAQIRRFARLWRVHFFIDESEKKRIAPWIGQLLHDAIFKLALGRLQRYEQSETIAQNIAKTLTNTQGSPWYGCAVSKEPVTAAYDSAKAATGMYPFGASSIRSYIGNDSTKS